MFLRTSSALVSLALLAACGGEVSPPPQGEAVDCAIGAGADYASVCTLEQVGGDIIIHHPDGGFRRLIRDPASGALRLRDGADDLIPQEGDAAGLAFSVGPDRYRIPRALLEPPAQP